METIINFLKDVRVELKRVSWPTREETLRYTVIVIVMSVVVAVYLGALDSLFAYIIEKFVF